METQQLAALAAMSNRYGADPGHVLAGGGNTSYKNGSHMWIKGSGTSLATIRPEDFVVMDRAKLKHMWQKAYPRVEAQREAEVLQDTMDARIPGETRRPSVETMLHDLFPQKFILHTHPGMVNGLTCACKGEEMMKSLFPEAVWVPPSKPGYTLALLCKQAMDAHRETTGKDAQIMFLGNHGLFVAADTTEEIDALAQHVMDTLSGAIRHWPDLKPLPADASRGEALESRLSRLYAEQQGAVVKFVSNTAVLDYDPTTGSLSPDHIVYAKHRQLSIREDADLEARFADFTAEYGYKPRIVFVKDLGMFACGLNEKEAVTAQSVMLDAIQVVAYTASFGGVSPMAKELVDFILGWEVERYRSKVSLEK